MRRIRYSFMIIPEKKHHWSVAAGRWSDVVIEAHEMSSLVPFTCSIKSDRKTSAVHAEWGEICGVRGEGKQFIIFQKSRGMNGQKVSNKNFRKH